MKCLSIGATVHRALAQQMRGYRQRAPVAVLHELGQVEHDVRQLGRVGRRQRLLQRRRQLAARRALQLRPARDEGRVEQVAQELRVVVRER